MYELPAARYRRARGAQPDSTTAAQNQPARSGRETVRVGAPRQLFFFFTTKRSRAASESSAERSATHLRPESKKKIRPAVADFRLFPFSSFPTSWPFRALRTRTVSCAVRATETESFAPLRPHLIRGRTRRLSCRSRRLGGLRRVWIMRGAPKDWKEPALKRDRSEHKSSTEDSWCRWAEARTRAQSYSREFRSDPRRSRGSSGALRGLGLRVTDGGGPWGPRTLCSLCESAKARPIFGPGTACSTRGDHGARRPCCRLPTLDPHALSDPAGS